MALHNVCGYRCRYDAQSLAFKHFETLSPQVAIYLYIYLYERNTYTYVYINILKYIYMSRAQQRSSSCICIVSAITWFSIIQLVCRSTLFFSLSLFLLFVSLDQSISVFLIVAHFYRSWNFWM